MQPTQDEPTPGTTDDPTPDDMLEDERVEASEDPAGGSDSEDSPGEDEDEVARLRRVNAQLLSEKESVKAQKERADKLERELERARAGGPASPTTDPSRADYEAARREYEQLEEDRAVFNTYAKSSDPEVARYGRTQLRALASAETAYREVSFTRDLKRVPAGVRDRVEELIRGGSVRTIKAAQDYAEKEMRLAELENGKGTKEDDDEPSDLERKRLLKAEAPQLTRRGVTGKEMRAREVTYDDYQARLESMRADGDLEGRRALIADRESGKIQLVRRKRGAA